MVIHSRMHALRRLDNLHVKPTTSLGMTYESGGRDQVLEVEHAASYTL